MKTVFLLFCQYLLNWLNLLDHAGNTFLLGDADETISARVARARRAGMLWAVNLCDFLTLAAWAVTFGRVTRDHCDYALDKRDTPNSREILNLSVWPPRFWPKPVNEVMPEEMQP